MNFFTLLGVFVFVLSCGSSEKIKEAASRKQQLIQQKDTIRITNDSLKYKIVVIESGFYTWLYSKAHPRGFYSKKRLKTYNQYYVSEWNNRVLNPRDFSRNLYTKSIDYNPQVDYGYEVNYLLYNYFVFFQRKHRQVFLSLPVSNRLR